MGRRALPSALLGLLLLSAGTGCATAPLKPEVPRPTWERIEELSAAIPPNPKAPKEAPFRVTLLPRFAFAGDAAWITCYVPNSLPARGVQWGLTWHRSSAASPVTGIEHKLLVERLACGIHVAWCEVELIDRSKRRVEEKLEVKGGSCDGGIQN